MSDVTGGELASLLAPRSIAIVGASSDNSKFGGRMIEVLLLQGFPGKVYPINPNRNEIFGRKAYPSLSSVAADIDMAVIVVPREKVLPTITECGAKGIRACVVITGQFGETGEEGVAAEREVVAEAKKNGIRILGVNCLGYFNRLAKIALFPSVALYIHNPFPIGNIGVVSQSGAILSTMLDRAASLGAGFSHGITTGNQSDISAAELVRFLIEDKDTKVICCYLEGLSNGQEFCDAVKLATARGKPVLILKAGRTAEGARAAFSHTASVVSDYEIFKSYLEAAGALLFEDPGPMLAAAILFERYGRFSIEDVIIFTNSGGGAAVVTDQLGDEGVALRRFSEKTRESLLTLYKGAHAHNPIDWGASPDSDEVRVVERSLQAIEHEAGCPIILDVILSNAGLPDIAQSLARGAAASKFPVLAVILPDRVASGARTVLRERRMCFVDDIRHAVKAVAKIREWSQRLAKRRTLQSNVDVADRALLQRRPDAVGLRVALDAISSKGLLETYLVRVNRTETVTSKRDAASAAAVIGYPVVLKLLSESVSHKSDIGGVRVGIADEAQLLQAWDDIAAAFRKVRPHEKCQGMMVEEMVSGELEFFVGVKSDPVFGPVLAFGPGGVTVEMSRDRAVLALPASPVDIRERLSGLVIAPLLNGYRGRPALDVNALVEIIGRVGAMAKDLQGRLLELDLNPVIVKRAGEGAVAVDARARFAESSPAMRTEG